MNGILKILKIRTLKFGYIINIIGDSEHNFQNKVFWKS